MSYQQKTGTLNPGGHPGSYNGQDAYNDMLITTARRKSMDVLERNTDGEHIDREQCGGGGGRGCLTRIILWA